MQTKEYCLKVYTSVQVRSLSTLIRAASEGSKALIITLERSFFTTSTYRVQEQVGMLKVHVSLMTSLLEKSFLHDCKIHD